MSQPLKSLVIFEKQLGDGVLLEPTLRAIADLSGGTVAVHGADVLEPLTALMPFVEWTPTLGPIYYTDLWVFETGSRAAWRAFWTRAGTKRLRVRKESHLRWWHRVTFDDIRVGKHKDVHNSLFFLQGVRPNAEFVAPRLERPADSWAPPDLPPAPFLTVNMTTSLEAKKWSAGKWRSALAGIQEAVEYPIVVVGTGDASVTEHVAEATSGIPVVNLVNKTNLRQFLFTLSRSEIYVGVEGAGSHIAMALGIPSIAIFSAQNLANPLNWFQSSNRAKVLIEPGAKWEKNGELLAAPEVLVRAVTEFLPLAAQTA
jgi:ADP-heptose:LPS heptosyltransferase